jgi:FkbM family methyltransferase
MQYNDTERFIYKHLQDEQSRDIFYTRLAYFKQETGESAMTAALVRTRIKYSNPQINSLKQFRELWLEGRISQSPILYGGGAGGANTLAYLGECGIIPACFCDRSADKQERGVFGHRCIAPEKLVRDYNGHPVIVTTVFSKYTRQICHYLTSNGFPENNIFFAFADYDNQYFGPDFIQPANDEVYIDCGAFNGDTVHEFFRWSDGRYSKIHAFEPDSLLFNQLMRQFSNNNRIILYNAAIYDKAGTISFNAENSGGNGHISSDGGKPVKTLAIDDIAPPKTTFIKMDVEGAELKALYGARDTILRDKPRLAVCVYHRAEDIIEIPNYILSLAPEYRLFLRHHSMTRHETVLYAVL